MTLPSQEEFAASNALRERNPVAWRKLFHKDLQPWIYHDRRLGWCLNSPLWQDIPLLLPPNFINERYVFKRARADEAFAKKDWSHYIWLHERPYRFSALERVLRRTRSKAKARELLEDVWTDAEFPTQHGWLHLLELFQKYGPIGDTSAVQQQVEHHGVYRGVKSSDYKMGMSWTRNPEQAHWFAKRFSVDGKGKVYVATGPAEAVLGYITSRGEDEVVLNPFLLAIEEVS